ncbi:hypothetical protein C482_17713 [Natrialba chahannaoensis JCM 10990]|uniref:DUF7350 domain-containing protein n=1 Tax=Natrialba chahannaoensis JCM 10990 TaxID=1227492 RepID=M0A8S9_9EURY|nr:iron transporter [Natrialba chahannaoensis]ELY94934.1 hypothetical protein C482_17713 [Natrialba chahannaoensis JCM 10990]
MRRRDALAAGGSLVGTLSTMLTAGCLDFETLRREDAWRELIVDPPGGIYVPPKIDGILEYDSETESGLEISLSAMRPHSFWTGAGTERARADLRSHHTLHLMASVRDAESEVAVPTTVTTRIEHADSGDSTDSPDATDTANTAADTVDQRTPWPMRSQRMGFHYGDNISLPGEGTYKATIRLDPPTIHLADEFADRIDQPVTITIQFEYNPAAIDVLERTLLDEGEGRGERRALEFMGHASEPVSPTSSAVAHSATGDDIVVTLGRADVSDGAQVSSEATEDTQLAIGVRTRYNRYPVPFAGLSVESVRDGGRQYITEAQETIDPDRGHHYRAGFEEGILESADELAVSLDVPPQVALHEGYETAFGAERVVLPASLPAL